MKDTFNIRYAKKSDIPEMTFLLSQLFEIEKDFCFVPEKHQYSLSLMLESDNACILIACFKEKVVGMCTLQWIISTAEGGCSGWVEDVIVDTPFRGKGVGSLLLSAVEEEARKRDLVRLQLLYDQNNLLACNFYLTRNWKITRMSPLKKILISNP